MSDLKGIERSKFEKLFSMDDGYVLDFSNRTFQNFIIDSINVDIYQEEQLSKAKSLRKILDREGNYLVGKVLLDLLNYAFESNYINDSNKKIYDSCLSIAFNLKNNSNIKDLNITSVSEDKSFTLLLDEIKSGKEKENPSVILDRLHTLAKKYITQVAHKYDLNTDSIALNGIFGLYIKELEKRGIIESDITKIIFKSNISILEKFNYIRNNKTLAHDNDILNLNESILIINNVIELLTFVNKVEIDNNILVNDITF